MLILSLRHSSPSAPITLGTGIFPNLALESPLRRMILMTRFKMQREYLIVVGVYAPEEGWV